MLLIIIYFLLEIINKKYIEDNYNYIIYNIFPVILSLINTNFRLFLIGPIKNNDLKDIIPEYITINNIYNNIITFSAYVIIFLIHLLIKYIINRNTNIYINLLKYYFLIHVQLSNYALYNISYKYEDNNIFLLLLNIYIYNIILFWSFGIIFNYIYGDNIYITRKKYKFLINNYKPQYKYSSLFLLLFYTITNLINIYENSIYQNIIIIVLNIINIINLYFNKIFENNKNNIIYSHIISIILNIMNMFNNSILLYLKYIILGFQIFYTIYSNRNINVINNDIELQII